MSRNADDAGRTRAARRACRGSQSSATRSRSGPGLWLGHNPGSASRPRVDCRSARSRTNTAQSLLLLCAVSGYALLPASGVAFPLLSQESSVELQHTIDARRRRQHVARSAEIESSGVAGGRMGTSAIKSKSGTADRPESWLLVWTRRRRSTATRPRLKRSRPTSWPLPPNAGGPHRTRLSEKCLHLSGSCQAIRPVAVCGKEPRAVQS